MASFIKLEDSPMFRKQVHTLELTTDELKDRCQRLHKGCKKYMAALGGACDADLAFADCLEAFGGGFDDPVSVSIGGPVFAKFITAFRELGTYKDHLRSQVDHMLSESLTQFMSVDLNDAKTNESMCKNLSSVVRYDKQRKRGIRPSLDPSFSPTLESEDLLLPMLSDEGGSFWMISGSECRRRFDKATNVYDQAREKFTSLKKGTRPDIVAELEEDLQNSRSTFEKCRFNLVNALSNIEAKKKYEFLESFSAIMDAHLKYFKLGYELFSNMEPFIHQVLTYAQQSKEMADVEQDKLAKRIQEFRTQAELNNQRVSSDVEASPRCDGIQVFGTSSYKDIEALMQSTADGEVLTIKEGYLLKRSSSLRADWKRRFFVLDSRGTLYYYRDTGTKPVGPQSHQSTGTSEHGSGVFGRFRRYRRALSMTEESLGCRTVDLRMSTIKIDAEHSDLRLCFRLISPMKTYTLQAETEADRMDWVDKIRGVITSLLNSPFVEQLPSGQEGADSKDFVDSVGSESALQDVHVSSEDEMKSRRQDCVSNILREIRGNDLCAECSAPEPDWSSLNLGILLCIECSGVHRNLGVHISKVRSITLDVKVWEPTILDLFGNLGNAYCNSVWEEVLQLQNEREDESGALFSSTKPKPRDAILWKERFIQSKYVEKKFIIKETIGPGVPSHAVRIWEAVKSNNLQAVYRLIVASNVNVNTCYDEVNASDLHHLVNSPDLQSDCSDTAETMQYDPAACQRIENSGEQPSCLQGCSLLHLACHVGDLVMLELLLQFGADINMCDFHGRTPLHHCISIGKNTFAKYLLKRGARSSIKDGGGQTALERAMEMGAITDEKLFILLTK